MVTVEVLTVVQTRGKLPVIRIMAALAERSFPAKEAPVGHGEPHSLLPGTSWVTSQQGLPPPKVSTHHTSQTWQQVNTEANDGSGRLEVTVNSRNNGS